MNKRDQRCYQTGTLINIFAARGLLTEKIPEWVIKKNYVYPFGQHLDEAAAVLCAFCQRVGEDFIYNGRDRDCRHLADWWDEHKQQDQSRGG